MSHHLEVGRARRLILVAAVAAVASAPIGHAAAAQCAPRTKPSAGVWETQNATLAAATTPTPDGIALVRGMACRSDLAMSDGVIEFELAPPRDAFAGIAFRMASSADYEIIYFRADSAAGRWVSVQYQPVYEGETTWQLYARDGFLANLPARIATTPDGWTRVRLAVSGTRADLYVGEEAAPALRVRALQRAPLTGAIGFWSAGGTSTTSNTAIRGLAIEPAVQLGDAGLPPETTSPGQLTQWHVSGRYPARDSTRFVARLSPAIRGASLNGRSVSADSSGLVSLTAVLGNPAGRQRVNVFGGAGWGVAYACTLLHSAVDQTRQLFLSYSDAAGVYLDGVLVYQGDNSYGVRGKDRLGEVGAERDSVAIHLTPGDHEITVAVADKAFGWGFRARLDSLQAVTLVP